MTYHYDFLIIGGGVAGMSFALKVANAHKGSVAIICKTTLDEANTAKAQGGIASLNHYSKGAVCEWLFGTMCGINVAGENRFTIAPRPGGHFEFAEASYDSVYGNISVRWDKTDGGYRYKISVPSNCQADIILPDGRKQTVGAGEYEF